MRAMDYAQLEQPRFAPRRPVCQRFQFVQSEFVLANNSVPFAPPKFVSQSPIVPKSAVASTVEACPNGFPDLAIVGENRTNIIQLVGRGNQARAGIRPLQVTQIILLAFAPRRFGIGIRVGASLHNVDHAFSKSAAYFFQHRQTATILHYIMQQGRDGEILVASGLEHE